MKVADFIQELQDLEAYEAKIYVIHEGNLTECRPCIAHFQDIYGNDVPYVFVQAIFQNISTPVEDIPDPNNGGGEGGENGGDEPITLPDDTDADSDTDADADSDSDTGTEPETPPEGGDEPPENGSNEEGAGNGNGDENQQP